jgi:membrane-associated phospholipid phosphatase
MESSMVLRRACVGLCISISALSWCRTAAGQSSPVSSADTVAREISPPDPALAEPTPGIRERIPAFKDLFTALPGDFRAMASRQNAGFAMAGALGGFGIRQMDQPVARSAWGAPSVDPVFAPGQQVGSFIVQTSAAFATYAAGRATNNARVAVLGAKLVRAQIVAQATTQAIKFSVQRTRPDGTSLSFPSGHTSASFATATVLHSELGWKVGVPAYAVAAWVGASRMERQRHYLSDVVVGATIGILAGRSVTIGRGAARFEISPMAAPGGAGVSFVKVGKK